MFELIRLTEFYKEQGFASKEAVEKAEKLIERRWAELERKLAEKQIELETRKMDHEEKMEARSNVGLNNDSIASASHLLHLPTLTMRRNAVAISATKALTALHGHASVSTEVSLRDTHGVERLGKIIFSKYEANLVDIAVIQLHDDQNCFSIFVPVCRERVYFMQSVFLIGCVPSLNSDESALSASRGEVAYIEPGANSSLFRSTYHCQDGLSGAGIFVAADGGGYCIVGVHIGAHDDTTRSPPPVKKTKTGNSPAADTVSELTSASAIPIYGHIACEIARVDDIADVLY